MLSFKYFDFLVGTSLLLVFFILLVFFPSLRVPVYIITAAWQITSIIIHSIKGWYLKHSGPRFYFHSMVLLLLLLVILGSLIPYFTFVYFILWLFAPLLSVIYSSICYDEWKALHFNRSLFLK